MRRLINYLQNLTSSNSALAVVPHESLANQKRVVRLKDGKSVGVLSVPVEDRPLSFSELGQLQASEHERKRKKIERMIAERKQRMILVGQVESE